MAPLAFVPSTMMMVGGLWLTVFLQAGVVAAVVVLVLLVGLLALAG